MNREIGHVTQRTRQQGGFVLVGIVIALGALAGGHLLMTRGAARPAASEFGFGPRTSGAGLYTATLMPTETLRPRKLQTMKVAISHRNGEPLQHAQIGIDGGMPQHGHGLPTRPRVTREAGSGIYEIDGVRFNMGGWWEFKVSITTPSGTDVVTFNLNL